MNVYEITIDDNPPDLQQGSKPSVAIHHALDGHPLNVPCPRSGQLTVKCRLLAKKMGLGDYLDRLGKGRRYQGPYPDLLTTPRVKKTPRMCAVVTHSP